MTNSFEPWHIWCILAIVLAGVEMLAVSFYLFCFAIACGFAAVVASLGAPLTWQLTAFSVSCLACMLVLRQPFHRYLYKGGDTKPVNLAGMLGLNGIVIESIGSDLSPGRVKIRGEEWRALSEDDQQIHEGTHISVVAVDGATVRVRPA